MNNIIRRIVIFLLVFTMCFGTKMNSFASTSDGVGEVKITGGKKDFKWPVPGNYNIGSCFLDPDAVYVTGERKGYHYALDISAITGTSVVASYSGTVIEAVDGGTGYYGDGFGNYVVIQHNYTLNDGSTTILYTRYSHLNSVSVSKGTTVNAGDVIGKVGASGGTYGPHLDFQILKNAWSNYTKNSIDPYANNLLELPEGLYKSATTDCCGNYLTTIKKIYSENVGSIPVGSYDTAEGGDACIHVTGWAYDPDTLDQSVTIHVYVDGTRIQNEYKANIERNDVNTAYGCGAYHGFDIEIPYSVAATGEHTVEVYALNTTYGESAKHLGAKTVTIKADTLAPTITDVEILDLTKNGFTIQCNVSDNAEVSEVKIAVWPHPDGSWNHVWHTATVSDGVATCYIDVNETHGGIVDYKYAAHIYAYDAAGNETKVGTPWIYVDATPPVISNVIVEEDSEGYTITCDVSDNGEVDYVQFPTWTTLNGQDDLVGNDGSWAYLECYRGIYADGKATFRVNKSEHNNETGQYQTDIYAHDKCNNESKYTLKYTIEDKVEEPPHSHSYVSKVTKEATCTEKGVKTYTCECKDSYTEEIPVKGHSYEEGSCIRCGAKDPDYVPETEVDSTSPQIIVESVTASAGETVDVKISLKNNPGIASMKLKVAYDSRLTLESVTYNNQLGGQSQQPQNMSSPVTLNWFNGAANSIGDIEYAILKFKLSDTAESGTKASISVNYNPDDIYNIAEDNISFAVVNGAINVIEHIPGDINGDKLVNNKDLSRLFQYLSEWDVEVVEEALDVNGDGNTNNKDLTRLFQYLSEWDVEIY